MLARLVYGFRAGLFRFGFSCLPRDNLHAQTAQRIHLIIDNDISHKSKLS